MNAMLLYATGAGILLALLVAYAAAKLDTYTGGDFHA